MCCDLSSAQALRRQLQNDEDTVHVYYNQKETLGDAVSSNVPGRKKVWWVSLVCICQCVLCVFSYKHTYCMSSVFLCSRLLAHWCMCCPLSAILCCAVGNFLLIMYHNRRNFCGAKFSCVKFSWGINFMAWATYEI